MPVRTAIDDSEGIYFITITCARWLPLFEQVNGYDIVYNWFTYLKKQGHYIAGYVIMPDHLHVLAAFRNTESSINSIVGNGKRFMAYEIVKRLEKQEQIITLAEMKGWVNDTDKQRKKKHEVFEPSFDWKVCMTDNFINQKLDYIHSNPCMGEKVLALNPQDYKHSSAGFYLEGKQGEFEVINVGELKDFDLTRTLSQSPLPNLQKP
jgi:REP element-mobilizing transposase RayT